jgi:hypothetical protein
MQQHNGIANTFVNNVQRRWRRGPVADAAEKTGYVSHGGRATRHAASGYAQSGSVADNVMRPPRSGLKALASRGRNTSRKIILS